MQQHCVWCQSDAIKKNGHHQNGKQNYYCRNCKRQFVEDAHHISETQKEMAKKLLLERISLSGICRCIGVSLNWLLWFMKKKAAKVPEHLHSHIEVDNGRDQIVTLELDELWAFVGDKSDQQWLWLAMEKPSRKILAYHVGARNKESLQQLMGKLPETVKKGLNITQIIF